MRRNLVIIGIVIIIAAIAVAYFAFQQSNAKAATATRVQTATVTRGNLVATVNEAGNIAAPTMATLAFQVTGTGVTPGTVISVNVQIGDKVKAGQVLMQLDPTNFQNALKTAQQDLTTAQANLQSAQLTQSEVPQKLIAAKAAVEQAQVTLNQAQLAYNQIAWQATVAMSSQATALQNATIAYQTALANYQVAAAGITDTTSVQTAQIAVDKAQTAVDQAQSNLLTDTKIVSPIDGSVATVNYNVGDTAGSGTAVIIADLTHLQVKSTVAEVDLPNIKVGEVVSITLDAVPNTTYSGKVAAIGPVGTVSSGVVNYPVIVNVTNPDGQILPAMTANLSIISSQRDNVLLAPIRAITTQGTRKTATVLYQGQRIVTPVTIGLTNDTSVEITSGLQEGDVLVIGTATTTTPRGGGGFGIPFLGGGG